MKKYKFVNGNKEYELNENNCSEIIHDEEYPVIGIEKFEIIELLRQQEIADFDTAYYDQPCQNCLANLEGKNEYFRFLEYHFYIFTKKGKYVISSISKEYEDTTFSKLLKEDIVDNSYIVSIVVCVNCGESTIEIEQCDV